MFVISGISSFNRFKTPSCIATYGIGHLPHDHILCSVVRPMRGMWMYVFVSIVLSLFYRIGKYKRIYLFCC